MANVVPEMDVLGVVGCCIDWLWYCACAACGGCVGAAKRRRKGMLSHARLTRLHALAADAASRSGAKGDGEGLTPATAAHENPSQV